MVLYIKSKKFISNIVMSKIQENIAQNTSAGADKNKASLMTVKELRPDMERDWDDFVERCAETTFFHKAGWKKVYQRAFGHNSYFLYTEAGGQIEGVVVLGHIKSRLFGNSLISSPFCVCGGIAAESELAHAK